MKLISLNCWAGKIFAPLVSFVSKQAADTDIFCFQEVNDNPVGLVHDQTCRANLFAELTKALPDHAALFTLAFDGIANDLSRVDHPLGFGLATFVSLCHQITLHRDVIVGNAPAQPKHKPFQERGMPRNMQVVGVRSQNSDFAVANMHGLWIPNFGKGDSPERLQQSNNINVTLEELDVPYVLCGDFNLDLETESLRVLEQGRRNLIKDFGVNDTRTEFYPAEKSSRHADYTLVSPGLTVREFDVPNFSVSDHKPMILEFDLTTPESAGSS